MRTLTNSSKNITPQVMTATIWRVFNVLGWISHIIIHFKGKLMRLI